MMLTLMNVQNCHVLMEESVEMVKTASPVSVLLVGSEPPAVTGTCAVIQCLVKMQVRTSDLPISLSSTRNSTKGINRNILNFFGHFNK